MDAHAPQQPPTSPPEPASGAESHLPAGPTTEAFLELKAAVEQLHAATRRWTSRAKSLKEPVRGALADTQSLDDQLHAIWVHLDRVLRGVPLKRPSDPSRWARPRYPFPDLTGEFPTRSRASSGEED